MINSRKSKWVGRVVFKILTGTPTGKRPLGRPRRRLEDSIRMGLKEIDITALFFLLLLSL